MDDSVFWALIELARAGRRGGSGPTRRGAEAKMLTLTLERQSSEVIGAFDAKFRSLIRQLNRWSVWGAGYTIAGGMSDDGFRDFRAWLIGKRRDAVEMALTRPDGLGEFVAKSEDVTNERLLYAASEALEKRNDPVDFASIEGKPSPEGDPFDENTVFSLYPKLAARFRS